LKISVIMCVFNGEKYLVRSIESILNQTYDKFEFIIIDDHSQDHSFEIIKFFAEKDKRIKYYRNSRNLGLTKSLNRAIKLCKGEFIARQDVDDISLATRFEKQLSFFKKHPHYSFCGTNGIILQNGTKLHKFFELNKIRKNQIILNCFTHASIMIKKNIFEKFGFYDETYTYGQDYELWSRYIYKYKLKAKNLPDILVVREIKFNRLSIKDLKKFIIQRFNSIRTKFKYLKYTNYKFRCIISIIIKLFEILTLYNLIELYSDFLANRDSK